MNKSLLRVLWCLLALTALGVAALAAWLSLSDTGQRLLTQARERSPNEQVRYLQRRLQGHPRWEAVILPPLGAWQRRLETEPPPDLPDLGKGQRPRSEPAVAGLVRRLRVDSPQAIREALLQAGPGTEIVVAPGLYPFDHNLRLGQDGRADAPIALRADTPGTVWLSFSQLEGVLVDRPYWRFENLDIRGTCARHDDCEHAFHVVGRAHHVRIHNNRIRDFNAPVKVNGVDGIWPDQGELSWNTLSNSTARDTALPVVMLDLVGAHHWRVHDNWVHGFAKAQGNQVAYGLFAKGASRDARFERNLVVCTPQGISRPGERVGISLGGGGTGASACRDGTCEAFEHQGGVVANNIVAHCNDVGLDANRAQGALLAHNTLINTAGIGVRRGSQVRLRGNLSDAGTWVRDGSHLESEHEHRLDDALDRTAALSLGFHFSTDNSLPGFPPAVPSDFHHKARRDNSIAGAIELQ